MTKERLTMLGNRVTGPITAHELETFDAAPGVHKVTFASDELTAFCPVTRQPDLYHIDITYVPDRVVVESKSLKLYLMGFRDVGIFGEDLASLIASDLHAVLEPKVIDVTLVQQVRGGLKMTVRASA